MEGVQLHIVLCRALAIVFSVATTILLIVSQYQQNWILYNFVLTVDGTVHGFTITLTSTTTADVGLWTVYYSTAKQYTPAGIPGVPANEVITGTVDSATSGFFTEGK